jgi:tryptophan synthase alpha chain
MSTATTSDNRIDQTFARLRADGQKGFAAYIASGDPDQEHTIQIALALQQVGVDLLELGVPFSDPLADGAVNQAAAGRALAAGTTVGGVFEGIRQMRARGLVIPVVLYTYLNPVYAWGFDRFLAETGASGADGVLVLDLPPDEAERNVELSGRPKHLRLIRLIAPTTPPDRVSLIAAAAEGFIYFVSREGVTGERDAVAVSLAERGALIRAATALPIMVGFGISTPEQAREAAEAADAVVVGSAIVRRIGELGPRPDLAARVAEFVRPMVEAVKIPVARRPLGDLHGTLIFYKNEWGGQRLRPAR